MDALSIIASDGTHAGLCVFPILGDLMSPTLNRGGFALVAPTSRWEGDGCYVLGTPHDPAIYRCASGPLGVTMQGDNPRYHPPPPREISREDFLADVLAKVVVTMNVVDRHRLPDALRI